MPKRTAASVASVSVHGPLSESDVSKQVTPWEYHGISWNHEVGILSSFLFEVVINNTMPFFKMLFAQLILGEKVGKEKLV